MAQVVHSKLADAQRQRTVPCLLSINNAPDIYAQEGIGTTVGGSGGPWVAALGGEYNMLINQEKDCVYHGGTFSASYGLYPTVAEVHGEVSYTWVWGFNVYDALIGIADFMAGNNRG